MGRARWQAQLLLVTLVVIAHAPAVLSWNWALVSGPKLSNAAVMAETKWDPRWGAAAAVIENPPENDEVVQTEAEKSRIFFMGGDDHLIVEGGGKLHNDIWTTTGARWELARNEVKRTAFGESFPSIVSQLRWNPLSGDMEPPEGQGYKEWLCCVANWDCETKACEDKVDPSQIRWSPRRSHGATVLDKTLFVMGGRARSLDDISPEESIGSIVGERNRWREISILMSDVWTSPDGVNWNMVNPGCYVHQADQMYKGAGVPYGTCFSDNDCRKKKLGNAECINGACVCKHWGPRERFGVVTFKDHVYVVGGVTHVQRQMCGAHSCGEQYRHVLNDVWRSKDGVQWDAMTLDGGWPARGDFGVAVGSGQLWIAGGRGVNSRVFGDSQLYNDVWSSTDGKTWELNTTEAPWEPRCMHGMEFNENQIVIFGGMTRVPDPPPPAVKTPAEKALDAALNAPTERTVDTSGTLATNADGETVKFELVNNLRLVMSEEVWAWNIVTGGAGWVMDFDNHTDTQYYVRPSSKLWRLSFLDLNTRLALNSVGITTVGQIQNTDPELTEAALEVVPEYCDIHATVLKIMESCFVQPITYDGEFYNDIILVEGDAAAEEWELGALQEKKELADFVATGCEESGAEYDEDNADVVCRWSPVAKRNMAHTVLNNQVYSFGGYESYDTFGKDVWYRDEHNPNTFITVKPAHESSDWVIVYACDEPGCLFEYRFYNVEEGFYERGWSISIPPLDLLEWLPGAIYRFEVRAIDPAGNKDPEYIEGRNAYTWEYVPALPVLLIVMLVLLFIALSIGAYLEWRRRRKKKAMERYAIKRMRRKFKGIKKDAGGEEVDWRQYYEESKAGAKGKALAAQMAKELEAQAGKKTKKKGKKEKKGKKGKQRGKGKDGKKKKKGKDKKKDGKKKGKDKKKKKDGKKKDGKKKDAKKKGKKKDGKKKDKKKKGKKKK